MTEAISDRNSYLDSETKKKLETLDTDYSKVNWDVQCSPFENHPGLVISVVSYADEYDIYELVVGVTNLFDTPIMIGVEGEAIGKDGSIVGETYIFQNSLGVGNTIIETILCDDVPDGRIHWTDLNLVLNESNSQYVSCEADWALSNSDDSSEVILKYNLYAMEPFVAGYIFGLALDQDGNVVYIFDMYEEEATSCLTNSIAADEDLSEREVKDVALFFNALTK